MAEVYGMAGMVSGESELPGTTASAGAGERVIGTVVSWKAQWGWVQCPEAGTDLFAHVEDVIGGGALGKGARVSLEVGTDHKSGKPRARNIEVLQAAPPEGTPAQGQGPRVEGTVAHWKEPWGWVKCEGEEKDVFAHREDVVGSDPFAPLEVGMVVTLELGTDTKSGRRRALNIEVPGSTDRMQGTLTSWKDMWGWINCPEITDGDIFAHKEDIAAGTYIDVGVPLSFDLGFDEKGRRRARRIVGAGQGKAMANRTAAMAAGTTISQIGGGGGAGAQASGGSRGAGGVGAAQFLHQRLDGLVASWKDQWGWISSPLFAGDIFAHNEDIVSGGIPEMGMHVLFTVGQDNKGRVRAKDIEVGQRRQVMPQPVQHHPGMPQMVMHHLGMPGMHPGMQYYAMPGMPGMPMQMVPMQQMQPMPQQMVPQQHQQQAAAPSSYKRPRFEAGVGGYEYQEGQVLEGECTTWRDKWGWIRVPGFNSDLFAHREEVDRKGELSVGQLVQCVVARDQKSGRWRAKSIVPVDEATKRMRMG